MQMRRFGVFLVPALLIANALLPSCGGGGSGASATATPNPPGARIVAITVCSGPPPSPVATKTPTTTRCSGVVSSSVAQGGVAAFHAQGKLTNGLIEDITTSRSTLWTSDSPDILLSLTNQPGAFAGVAQGCACILASNGGLSSQMVGVTVFSMSTPACTPCPNPSATPAAAAARGNATASDSRPGVLQWTFDAGAPIRAPIVARPGGGVYFVSADAVMHAVDAGGREVFEWSARAIGRELGNAGTIFIQGVDDRIHALNPDGVELWRMADGAGPGPLAVAADGTLYAAGEGALLSIGTAGSLNWRIALDGVSAAAATSDGGAIAGVAGGAVTAFSRNGSPRWSFTPAGGFTGAIAVAGDVVYAGSAGGELDALSPDGTLIRRVPSDSPRPIVSGPVAGADGIIYFGSDRFYALAPDGTIASRWDLPEPGEAAPLAGGGLILAGADGLAAAVDTAAAYRWSTRIAGPITAASGGELVFLGGGGGLLYAIR